MPFLRIKRDVTIDGEVLEELGKSASFLTSGALYLAGQHDIEVDDNEAEALLAYDEDAFEVVDDIREANIARLAPRVERDPDNPASGRFESGKLSEASGRLNRRVNVASKLEAKHKRAGEDG